MGKRGGEKGGERVVSGYVHPRRRVSFNREREKLFPRDEEGKKEGEGGKERREAASKRGVAVVGERYKCVNRSCYTLGFKWRARPLRFNYGWLTFLTFVRKPRVTLLAARIIFLLIILITRGLKTKTRSRRLNINYGG